MINKTKTIENLEISGDTVIIRERIAIIEDGNDDYSLESDKIKAVVEAARFK